MASSRGLIFMTDHVGRRFSWPDSAMRGQTLRHKAIFKQVLRFTYTLATILMFSSQSICLT